MNMQDLLPGLDAVRNVHPMLVHLPLGLWPTALGFLLIGALRANDQLFSCGRWLLYLASSSAVVAALSGWNSANGLGHDTLGHDLVHVHRNWMLTATALSAATSLLAFALRGSQRRGSRAAVALALFTTLGVASLGADRGAFLVYGKGVATNIQADSPPGAPNGHDDGHAH